MMKHGLGGLLAVLLVLTTATIALGQTTTTVTKNPDGTYTIIEYPLKKEIQITLNPVSITTGKAVATVLRDDTGTTVKLNMTEIPADVTALTLYAVDDTGKVTPLGPIAISSGTGTFTGAVPLSKFMLVASPAADLATYTPETKVLFRSVVPEGFAVIPVSSPSGEKVAAISAPSSTVPMLNIPAYKKGDDTKIKVDFSGALTGARANVFITPRKDGPTEVKMRFHELKEAPAGQAFILWAVGADGKFQKLGQVVNTAGRNEAEIKAETTFSDFGLLVTMEDATATTLVAPAGPRIGIITLVP